MSSTILSPNATAFTAAEVPISPHAMPTHHEIAASLAVVRAAHGPLNLTPIRVQVFAATSGGRHVLLHLWSPVHKQFYESLVALAGRSLVVFRPLPQVPLNSAEKEALGLIRQDPRFSALASSKQVNASDLVMVPCSASTASQPHNVRGLFFHSKDLQLNTLLQPIDGLFPVVDVKTKTVHFLDRFDQPFSSEPAPVLVPTPTPAPQTAPLRSDARTLAEHAAHALSVIHKQHLSEQEADQVMNETISYWKNHVNAGFLKYRKSVADGSSFAALDWADAEPGTAWFYDHRGSKYLDLLGGFGIYNVGRRHPKVMAALHAQLNKQALHSQELLDPLRAYCAHLVSLTMPSDSKRKLSHCFFTNSGTESVEACLKMAFVATGRKQIVAAVNAFHGKTLGALSCTSKAVFRAPFVGTFCQTTHVPFNDIASLRQVFASSKFTGNEIAGLILEPIQGEGGIHVGTAEYMRAAREICDEYGAMLIFDEVQSGMGRTGKWWACQHWGVCPDLMAIGKGFGGGVAAAGACVGTEQVWAKYVENPFLFTTTFGGNPLALSASIATINVLIQENLLEAATARGNQFLTGLRRLQAEYPDLIKDIRGTGLMIGIEFKGNETGVDFSRLMFARKVLVSGTLVNALTIRVEPPLTIKEQEVDYCLATFAQVLQEIRLSRIPSLFPSSKL